mgnify:CR=1 FL=1
MLGTLAFVLGSNRSSPPVNWKNFSEFPGQLIRRNIRPLFDADAIRSCLEKGANYHTRGYDGPKFSRFFSEKNPEYNYANQNGVGIRLGLFYQIFFIGIPLCITIASGYLAFKNFNNNKN